MRRRLIILLGLALLAFAGGTAFVRWSYFSQVEHPRLRLSRQAFPPLTGRLVIVLMDSIPFEMAFDPTKLPYVSSLRPRATWGLGLAEEPTMTGQMVYTIVSGVRPFLYNVVRNWRQNRMPHETLLDSLRRAGLRLELYGDVPWTQMFGDRFHRQFAVPEEGRRPDGRPYDWPHAVNDLDLAVLPHLDEALSAGRKRWDVLVWTIHGTDLVMHRYLRDSKLTYQKLRWADLLVKGVIQQLDDGRTSFLLLSDHGCAANGRHGYEDPEARRTFYLLMGPGIVRGKRFDLRQIDLAPTVNALYGLTPPAASAGRPAVEALAVDPAQRAARLLAAAEQRQEYLRRRERWLDTGLHVDAAPLKRAREALSDRPAVAAREASRYLRRAWAADLGARRERRVALPVLAWLALLGLLVGVGLLLARTPSPAEPPGGTTLDTPGDLLRDSRGDPPRTPSRGSPGDPPRGPPPWRAVAAATALLAGLWGAALVAAYYSGRFFNDHFDLWPPPAQVSFWLALGGLVAAAAWLARRRAGAAWRAHPALWSWTGALALAVLPGYFQGLYALVLLMLLMVWVAWRRAEPLAAPADRLWLGLGLLVLAGALVWENSWRPHFYLLRGQVEGAWAALAAVAGFLVAAAATLRREPAARRRGVWLGVGLLAFLLGLRHLLWPLPPMLRFPTVGDQLVAELSSRLLATGLTGAGWLVARRLGLRGPAGAAVGALAVLCAWGSAFEALAFALLVAALAPLGRLRWLRAGGLAGAALAAGVFVLSRIMLVQVHEFHFNFTSVHDLMRFAPDMDELLPALAGPVALRYTLPALVLVPLILGRLEPAQRLQALLLSMAYVGGRSLHLLVTTRLTIDQLYANWRGVGELIITALWAAGLLVAFTALEIAAWLGRRRAVRDTGPASAGASAGPDRTGASAGPDRTGAGAGPDGTGASAEQAAGRGLASVENAGDCGLVSLRAPVGSGVPRRVPARPQAPRRAPARR
jgi:hypothetical protein